MIPSSVSLLSFSIGLAAQAVASPLSTNSNNVNANFARTSSLPLAPLLGASHDAPHGTVNNSYIVFMKPELHSSALSNHFNFLEAAHQEDPLESAEGESGVKHVYDGHIRGYAGWFTENTLNKIRSMPEVDFVERDQIVKTQEVQAKEVQRSAPWGLARISHRPRLSFGTFTRYEYSPDGGEGVDVYVIDTGINIHHAEFEGRAFWGKTIPQNDVDEDNNGHGTHCAGTIASRKYGVAKAANVIAVKVLGSNGSGTMSDVVSGVVFAADSAVKKAAAALAELKATGSTKHKGSVANMSLGGGKSRALDQAVNGAVDAGLHFAVAAGNDNRDACNYSPAAAEKAVTVGASTLGDERAYFSNYGKCVDIFAPGLNILSTWIGSDHAINTISGTSMASPHTAGLLAYLLSIYPSATFDPSLSSLVPPPLNTVRPGSPIARAYQMAYSVLPSWVSSFLPPMPLLDIIGGGSDVPAFGENKSLSPAQLKAALVALSTKDILTEIPSDTVNLLAFNNATAA
ncbi:subtilisin-like serine protease [Stereum hirsutum FP-91666 SS1]|uniref:subtilisin-like serine protease n=1 Tax=Stereum hirsutum (strain FP-91666) TaxID=721885 RepID=UPI000444A4F5|nr:subtilisin-like serine protease [Stereum hirsutum FP-91666 SS1]EIM80732.1 subtilisin-like serine protease [Stereum hirsutum FP-91666 SS1]